MNKTDKINALLKGMREQGKLQDMKGKGDMGEDAALQIVLERQRSRGGLVYQSFRYPYQTNRQGVTYLGNIKLEDGVFVEYTEARNGRTLEDEIDLLYVSRYRIIPVEVKSYHATVAVYNDWMDRYEEPVDKSPVAQAEKHARHLYHALAPVIPDGRPEYIRPIVCFVDRCKLVDDRVSESIDYLPCCVLNGLKRCLVEIDTPLRFDIDVDAVQSRLKEIRNDVKREYV